MELFIVMRFVEYFNLVTTKLNNFTTSRPNKNGAVFRMLTNTLNLWVKRLDIRMSEIKCFLFLR